MPNEVKQLEGGKLEVKLETGEVFAGDALEVANKMAEAHVNTKRWGQDFKSKFEEANAAIKAPPEVRPASTANPDDVQLQNYLLTQTALALGYKDADEYKQELVRVKRTTDEINNQAIAASFMQACPDFPNTPEAIKALSEKVDAMHWDMSPQSMIAAHTLCAREEKYKPLTAEEYNQDWSTRMQQANRQPPPMLNGSNNETRIPPVNEYTEPLDQMRTRILNQQRAGNAG